RCASRWPSSASGSPRSARPRCTRPAPTPSRSSPPCAAAPRSARCWPSTRPRCAQTGTTPLHEARPTRRDYSPLKPYCAVCGRDTTTVTGFDDETTEITYTCACGAQVGPVPIAEVAGKLVWKVDCPMRWAYERVTFEPAGVDHASPGSSFTVGGELVSKIFGGEMPLHFGYAFVGTSGGSSKMSGSAGRAPTPADALEIFEAPLIRWLYARRRPEQSITLA